MRPKTFRLIEMAVIDGVDMGYAQAYKHANSVKEGALKEHIVREILNSIDEWFDFDD